MKREIYEYYKRVINSVTNPLEKSNFQKTGKLTPGEFVEAGDALIQKNPCWSWAKYNMNNNDGLPQNKKYLILSQCPSYERAKILSDKIESNMDTQNSNIENNDDWILTANNQKYEDDCDSESDGWGSDDWRSDEDDDCIVVKKNNMRKYDLTIIYDKYYCCPRMYFIGYDSSSNILTKDQILEDVLAENREKTVTVDIHPYLNIPALSIHPCRHAETMQRIIGRMEQRFNEEYEQTMNNNIPVFIFPHRDSLFVFLKFIGSVVPTIKYDSNFDVEI